MYMQNVQGESQGTVAAKDKSLHFNEAEKRAQVPFLHHQVLEFDCNGLQYTIKHHDITLRIPEEAVACGVKTHFEIAVAMYGPFSFPKYAQPISPIIWLCVLEENVKLKKPFHLIVPHFLTGLTNKRLSYHQVKFVKASHNCTTVTEDGQRNYNFNHCDTVPLFASSRNRSYGVLKSTHCCFYCLQANQTPELARDAGYCLIRIERILSLQRYEVYFTAVYYLDTCIQVKI